MIQKGEKKRDGCQQSKQKIKLKNEKKNKNKIERKSKHT